MAEIAAKGGLRSFAGELVTTGAKLDRSMTLTTMAGEGVKTEKEYADTSSHKRSMSTAAAELRLPGVSTIGDWECVHPLSQTGIATQGVVVGWNLSSSMAANDLGALLVSLGGSKGGPGNTKVTPPSVATENNNSKVPASRTADHQERGASSDR